MNQLTAYTLRLGDNCLVLSQRLGEWCGHAPELEIDLALANIGLDLLGQARNFLSYAAELAGEGDEDTLAFTRDERQFSNLLLVEQPNGNFADTIARQYFIDAWHVAPKQLKKLAITCVLVVAGWSDWAMVLTYQGKRCSRPSTSCGVLPPNCSMPTRLILH